MQNIKAREFNNTNKIAEEGLMIPEGISRRTVLAFRASILRSTYLLNAMAALLAKIMQRMINPSNFQLKTDGSNLNPRKKDNRANGRANMVWANLIREKYDFMV